MLQSAVHHGYLDRRQVREPVHQLQEGGRVIGDSDTMPCEEYGHNFEDYDIVGEGDDQVTIWRCTDCDDEYED